MSAIHSTSPVTQTAAPWAETDKRIASALGIPTTALNTSQDEPLARKPAPRPLAPKSHNARQSQPAVEGKANKRQAINLAQEDHTPAKKRKVATGNNAKSSDKKSADALLDVSDVALPVEDVGMVSVYETCDGIRRQIRTVLKKPGMTQAAFCRALGKFGAVPDGKALAPGQLARFLEQKGPMKGNMNAVFYPSYVLLEKMRIRDGKDKSKFRKEMEEKHEPRGGVNIDRSSDTPIILHVSERAWRDRWGVLHIEKKPSFR